MASRVISGGEKLRRAVHDIGRKLGRGGSLKVGFLADATYPDGTPVAMVAAVNEFGRMVRSGEGDYYQLPRPFFRNMVARRSPEWPAEIASQLRATDYNARLTMNRMGEHVKGQLQQSIRDFNEVPLAPSTIRAKGFSKQLIDSAVLLNSADYEYEER